MRGRVPTLAGAASRHWQLRRWLVHTGAATGCDILTEGTVTNTRQKIWLAITTIATWCAPQAQVKAESGGPKYRIKVSGPLAEIDELCNAPCEIERVRVVGRVEATAEVAQDVQTGERKTDPHVTCTGNCGGKEKASTLTVSPARSLREGVEFSIVDGMARFVFYSVTETERGPATLQGHSSFRIDRPLLALELRDHEVELTVLDPETVSGGN